ncbi:LOW QUALITY PROTEIN: carbonic anhydrase 4-like [Eleginops maclovinus]|uniref:LOW QUALITY PROTEIN: carbonic anhydrase 4-like n=1 Tax=Eleginops maclovinus TaxID=56733 RepID=UPI00307FEC90
MVVESDEDCILLSHRGGVKAAPGCAERIKSGRMKPRSSLLTEKEKSCMKMNWLVTLAAVCVLVPSVHCATGSGWCYHDASCNDTQWGTLFPSYCAGNRQSPIDIVSASATADSNLTAFTFTNFNDSSALTKIANTGKTVKVTLASGVQISGGGLSDTYDSLQFHLHWGNGSSVPGSEHTVNGKRYAMELHIVHSKATYGGNTTLAVKDSTGLAALGFFIEIMSGNETGQPAKWNLLSSYLSNIITKGSSFPIPAGISVDDLLVGVDRAKYYRYLGSLTTPTCNEAVVWTLFKDPIKVSKDVIDRFSTTVRITDTSSQYMTNVFRSVQAAQSVTTQSSSSTSGYSLGLMALSLVLGRV